MKSELRLYTQQLNLPGGKLGLDETWMTRLVQWLPQTDALITRSIADEDRIEYGEALLIRLNHLSKFVYCARRERDLALGAGYEKHPKGAYNSASQEALARKYATEEICLREYLNELEIALKLRLEMNRTAIVNHRTFLQNAG